MNKFLLSHSGRYISEVFAEKASNPKAKPKKRPAPISVRLSEDERAQLRRDAGNQPLNAYIRSRLFDAQTKPRRPHGGASIEDRQALARVLSALGKSNLSRDLEKLAYVLKDGALHLQPGSERLVQEACRAVVAMRTDLMQALGLKP